MVTNSSISQNIIRLCSRYANQTGSHRVVYNFIFTQEVQHALPEWLYLSLLHFLSSRSFGSPTIINQKWDAIASHVATMALLRSQNGLRSNLGASDHWKIPGGACPPTPPPPVLHACMHAFIHTHQTPMYLLFQKPWLRTWYIDMYVCIAVSLVWSSLRLTRVHNMMTITEKLQKAQETHLNLSAQVQLDLHKIITANADAVGAPWVHLLPTADSSSFHHGHKCLCEH